MWHIILASLHAWDFQLEMNTRLLLLLEDIISFGAFGHKSKCWIRNIKSSLQSWFIISQTLIQRSFLKSPLSLVHLLYLLYIRLLALTLVRVEHLILKPWTKSSISKKCYKAPTLSWLLRIISKYFILKKFHHHLEGKNREALFFDYSVMFLHTRYHYLRLILALSTYFSHTVSNGWPFSYIGLYKSTN